MVSTLKVNAIKYNFNVWKSEYAVAYTYQNYISEIFFRKIVSLFKKLL